MIDRRYVYDGSIAKVGWSVSMLIGSRREFVCLDYISKGIVKRINAVGKLLRDGVERIWAFPNA